MRHSSRRSPLRRDGGGNAAQALICRKTSLPYTNGLERRLCCCLSCWRFGAGGFTSATRHLALLISPSPSLWYLRWYIREAWAGEWSSGAKSELLGKDWLLR